MVRTLQWEIALTFGTTFLGELAQGEKAPVASLPMQPARLFLPEKPIFAEIGCLISCLSRSP